MDPISFILQLAVLLPIAASAVAVMLRGKETALGVLLKITAALHFILTFLISCRVLPVPGNGAGTYLHADRPGVLILSVTSVLFLAVSIYLAQWLPLERMHAQSCGEKLLDTHIFAACLLAFLGTMSLVILSSNLALMWVAVEATTLVSAPLIMFYRSGRSVEAMWKYLLVCSVGIGLALLGTMVMAIAASKAGATLDIGSIRECVNELDPKIYRAAFLLILAGYGTKMGLAPFHTWLPDAHSEAPGGVSALLSGALLNCSFLGIVRYYDLAPVSEKAFCNEMLIALGLLSLAAAAFFIVRQTDFKRMLAYSSVEHMGLIAILFTIDPVWSALHVCGHSLLKMSLFLIAGNLLLGCGTRQIPKLGGLSSPLPRNAMLWLAGALLICGLPPSPLFATELLLVFRSSPAISIPVLLLLFIVFAGMTYHVLRMIMGQPGETVPEKQPAAMAEKLWLVPALMLTAVLIAGSLILIEFLLVKEAF